MITTSTPSTARTFPVIHDRPGYRSYAAYHAARAFLSDGFLTALAAYVAVTHYRYQEQVWANGHRPALDALIAAGMVKVVDGPRGYDMPDGTGLPKRAPAYPIYLRRIVAVEQEKPMPPANEVMPTTDVTPLPTPAPVIVLALPAPACSICSAPAPRHTYADKPVCDNCHGAILSYSLKVKGRAERLYGRAEKMAAESASGWQRARVMADAIPFGQPILVGHHSEKRDRAYRERIWNTQKRAYEKGQQAEDLERRARASEKNRAISSDDPAAVLKLQEKLKKQEAWQETMKGVNALIRKHIRKSPEERARLLCEAFPQYDEFRAARLVQGDLLGRYGYPDYALKNNGAEIRRLKKRIDELQAQRTTVAENARQSTYGDITLERDAEDNRLRLMFPGKPSREVIACLKSNGFRWSPTNHAWQRQLNAGAEYAAQRVIEFAQQQ